MDPEAYSNFELSEAEKEKCKEIRESLYKLSAKVFSLAPNKEGVIEFQGRRFVLLNTLTFAKIHEVLGNVLGAALRKQLLYKFGNKAGEDIAKMFQHLSFKEALKILVKSGFELALLEKLKGNSPLEISSKILGYGTFAGWMGKAEITHFSENPPFARIIMYNTFESVSLKDSKPSEPSCVFLSGVVNGVLKTLIENEKIITEEVKCQACGDEYCEFIVKGVE